MERKEFESRITRMRPQLLQLAIRYLNNGDDAEDVVQDTLLKLWFLRDRLDDYRSVDSLASVITRHLAISCIRSRRSGMVDIDELYDVKGDELTETKIIREESLKEIFDAISALPDLQQSILRMKHVEGFEVEEIAAITGSNPGAVRVNLSRARKRVKQQFMPN